MNYNQEQNLRDGEARNEAERRPYEEPRLEELGNVHDVTQQVGVSVSGIDPREDLV